MGYIHCCTCYCTLQAFTQYRERLLASQKPENRQMLDDCFTKLLSDVQRSLDNTNRDRFTQRLTSFRIAARQFLTM
jgi:exportin-7